MGHAQVAVGDAKDSAVLGVLFFFLGEQHVDAGVDQKYAEDVHDPGEVFDQFGARRDHHTAHDQRADHSPLEQAMLHAVVHGKRAENDQEEKKIVDAQRFFDEVAGEKFERRLAADIEKNSGAEKQGDADPDAGPQAGFAYADFVGLVVQDTQVQGNGDENEYVEGDPEKRRPHRLTLPASGSGRRASVGGVEVGELDTRSLAWRDGYRYVPANAHIAGSSIQVERADPVSSRRQPCNRAVSFEVGVGFGYEVLFLRDLGGRPLHAFLLVANQLGPLALRVHAVKLELHAAFGFGMRGDKLFQRDKVFLMLLLVFFRLFGFVRVFVLRLGDAVADAAAVGALVGQKEFRNFDHVVRSDGFVEAGHHQVHDVVSLEPGFEFRGNLQVIDEFLARRQSIFRLHVLGDLHVALGQDIKGELADGFGPRRSWRNTSDEIQGALAVLRVGRRDGA